MNELLLEASYRGVCAHGMNMVSQLTSPTHRVGYRFCRKYQTGVGDQYRSEKITKVLTQIYIPLQLY
jgi:hypothetical protein